MFKKLKNCHNSKDFRSLAQQRIPSPIFHYIDGAADDEITLQQNTKAFEKCDLVPNILRGVEKIDLGVTLMGKKINLPLFFSPTALQRLFHHQGELAVAKVAEKFGTFFGISSLATVSIEEIANSYSSPKMFQLYVHKDKGLNNSMIEKCIENNFDAIAVTVDTIVSGNRERDFYTGFTSPPKLTLGSLTSFATHPNWTLNYLLRKKFELPQLQNHVKQGTDITVSVGDYFNTMLDQNMNWETIEEIKKKWGKHLCIKGVMSVEDAKKAVDVGATAIMVSNHGGRQLDGSRAPFDQLAEIVDAVGDKIDVICDGGIRRGTHVLKALSVGAKACSGGRMYLYALAGAGEQGVSKAMGLMKEEIERGMKLMGCKSIKELGRHNLRFR
ncbi:MAG: alpha-hydroxy-acid oxidizing protein [SAR202 cluster bacterium]|nr:alpha-hydroxy-acid oxidizing protein [SAR202 cluster bacterium]|tara:strand:- start:20404 stop:21558 length:1155 start_codon:yes stop_codon:yes gene_type:complete